MKRLIVSIAVLAAFLVPASPAAASFGFTEAGVAFNTQGGAAATQAGSHPYSATTFFGLATHFDSGLNAELADGEMRDLRVALIPGLVGDPNAVPPCSDVDFATRACPVASQVGWNSADIGVPFANDREPVYRLEAPPGVIMRVGFLATALVPVTVDLGLSQSPPYEAVATLKNIPNVIPFKDSSFALWGVPADPSHNGERVGTGNVSNVNPKPFLIMPRACTGPLRMSFEADSWTGEADSIGALTEVAGQPRGMGGCEKLGLQPTITAQPTSKAAASPTGLDFSLDLQDEGLKNPNGLANSDVRKTVVTLPQGFSVNPSQAEGLNVCSEADLARETATSAPGSGCPNEAKVGTVEVESPLVEEALKGALYVATPYENPFHSLIALYMVLQNEKLGVSIHLPLKVQTDPQTGQITTSAEDLPQLPFSHFRLHFREGTRSPLATPPSCGTYAAKAVLYPWAGGAPVTSTSSFQIIAGPEGKPCPAGGTPPFHPELLAGSMNNAAGRYSPFDVRISRNDSEQEITHFSIKLPPGITGKLAGIPFCSDAAIAAAKAREGQPHGGQEELDHPSCPGASEVGRTLVGAGVGPSLAYVPGKVYLAGPYHGSAISIAAITAAKAGPFDLGTVVVRYALRINPETAEVFVDATGSDPIPHIIAGIPVHLRDVRAYVDRPGFALNPTSCAPTSTASTVLGSGTDFVSEADDVPVTVASRYQAADCASLAYKPKLSLKLKGSTKRGGNPALTATLKPRPGDANSKRVSVALPHSEFLDQAHIKTICTRVQFKAGDGNGSACPAGSIYGHARAYTPLLSEALEGPIFLRSSEHPLPDLVLALHGLVDFTAVGRIDSVHGGIRNTFETIPDAPISKVIVEFAGGKKGLLQNSTNICKGSHKATVKYGAQNGRLYTGKVPLKPAKCKGKKHKKSAKHRRAR